MIQKIITVDGPSGSGKGTISAMLSKKLGWHLLDSGALYRVLGVAAKAQGISIEAESEITQIARNLDITFLYNKELNEVEPHFSGKNYAQLIRTDEAGQLASQVAAIGTVREALLARQRDFYQEPGLVADGRDMGTLVFPDAPVKIFLTASAENRAERRYKQLINKGLDANIRALLDSIKARDERDKTRPVAPLVPAEGAFFVDSSNLTIEETFKQVLDFTRSKLSENSV